MRRPPADVAAAVGAAILLRVLFRIETHGDAWFGLLVTDARSYRELAAAFASGQLFHTGEALWFAPFYPAFLGALSRVVGPDPDVVRLLQHAAGVVTAGVTADVARRAAPGAGWWAGLLLALSPVPVFFESQLLPATWGVLFTALFLHRLAAGRAAASGALLGALSWVRTGALLFAPVGAWLFARAGRRPALAFVAALATALAPVALWNGITGGTWTPLTANAGFLMADGLHEDAAGGRTLPRAPEDFAPHGAYHREAERIAGRSLTLAEASRVQRNRALRRVSEDPVRAARLAGAKLDLLANVREIDDNLGFETVRDRARTLAWLPGPWAWALVPGLLGAGLAFRRRNGAMLAPAAFAGAYAVSLLPFFVTSRYRLPLLVPLAVLGGFAASDVWRALRERGARALLLPVAAVALLVLATVVHDPGLRPDTRTRLVAIGSALQDAGRSADALAVTDRAIALGEDSAMAHQNRAVILLALDRVPEAMAAADTALARDAEQAAAWNTRGVALARLGRMGEAAESFRRAVTLDPGDGMARRNLEEAEAAIAEAAAEAAN